MDLFPSTLIISSDRSLIEQKITDILAEFEHKFTANNPDLFFIDETSGWGIEEVRKIKNFLAQKPFNHSSKFVLVFDSQELNHQAQNALLKTLEEPGPNNFLILTTNKPSSLLSTIISRCHRIKIKSTKKATSTLLKISGNLSKDLSASESLSKNKEEVLPLLEDQLKLYQSELLKDPNRQTQKTIEKIIKAIQMIRANVDPKSALDYFFLG
jgi:replication-associated recombination protein RarA